MKRRTLGKTGLEVTVLGYGAAEIRSPKASDGKLITDEEAGRLLNDVLDGGINFIDTAPDYRRIEELIGKFISGRRSEYYLATKCGCNIPARDDNPEAPKHLWTRGMLMRNIELSLSRMKTDYVDIWQLHNATVDDVEKADLVSVMEDVKQQGKVRHVSVSSILPHITTYIERGWFTTYQIPYSALQRAEENTITAAAESGAGTIVRGGVARGEPGIGHGRSDRWDFWVEAKLDELRGEGESRSAFLLRFTLSHPHMHTTIIGTKNHDHLAENLKTSEIGSLPEDVYAEAKRRLTAAGQTPE